MNLREEFCQMVLLRSFGAADEWFRGKVVEHVLKGNKAGTFFTSPTMTRWIEQLIAGEVFSVLLLFLECGWIPETEQLNKAKGRPVFTFLLENSAASLLGQFAPLISAKDIPEYTDALKAKLALLTNYDSLPMHLLAVYPSASWINKIIEKQWFSEQLFQANPACSLYVDHSLITYYHVQALPYYLIYCHEQGVTPDPLKLQVMLEVCKCEYLKSYVQRSDFNLASAAWLARFHLLPEAPITDSNPDASQADQLIAEAKRINLDVQLIHKSWIETSLSPASHRFHFKVMLALQAPIVDAANQVAVFWPDETQAYYLTRQAIIQNRKQAQNIISNLLENGKLSSLTWLLKEGLIIPQTSKEKGKPRIPKKVYRYAARCANHATFQRFLALCNATEKQEIFSEALNGCHDTAAASLLTEITPTQEQITQVLCNQPPMRKTMIALLNKYPDRRQSFTEAAKCAGNHELLEPAN
jgi:hypothetical protein